MILSRVVKHLLAKHEESRIMTTSQTNIIEIIESCTKLWADKRISWWLKFTSDAIWLETEDTSSYEVNIISPSSNNWISLNWMMRNSSCAKACFIILPALSKGSLFAILKYTISYKGIFPINIWITAWISFNTGPIPALSFFTVISFVSHLSKCGSWIEFIRIGSKLRLS